LSRVVGWIVWAEIASGQDNVARRIHNVARGKNFDASKKKNIFLVFSLIPHLWLTSPEPVAEMA